MVMPTKISMALTMTLLRAVLVVPMICFLIAGKNILSVLLFCAALATDILDGFFARHFSQVTSFGAYLDALVDKILIYVLLVFFLWKGVYFVLLVALCFLRDLAVSIIRNHRLARRQVINANKWGKLKFVMQATSIFLAFASLVDNGADVYAICANLALVLALLLSIPGVLVLVGGPSDVC